MAEEGSHTEDRGQTREAWQGEVAGLPLFEYCWKEAEEGVGLYHHGD